MSRPVRVVVANDDVFLRNLLRLVCAAPAIHVVAETASVRELAELVAAEQPDVVVTELSFADGDLRDHLAAIMRDGTKVLVLSSDPSPERLTDLLALGACGYLLQDTPPEHVTEAVLAVAEGNVALAPAAATTILEQWRFLRSRPDSGRSPSRGPSKPELTPREAEVLAAMSDGLSTKAIARRLEVAVKTVENHKIRIFDKLGVRSQAQAVSIAIGHALLEPPAPALVDLTDAATGASHDA